MDKKIIGQLRSLSMVKGKEPTVISRLDDRMLYELFIRIKNGETSRAIARHAQTVWGIGKQSSVHSLAQGIQKFRQRIRHLLPPRPPGTSDLPECFIPPESEEESTLETMENIARQYEARIKRMMAEEKERGVTFPYISRDLQALANLKKAILKQKEWDASHEDPHNRKKFESMQKTIDRRFNTMMDTLGEDGQERMMRMANKFLELVEKEAVPMDQLEDGSYTFTNPEEPKKLI